MILDQGGLQKIFGLSEDQRLAQDSGVILKTALGEREKKEIGKWVSHQAIRHQKRLVTYCWLPKCVYKYCVL